MKGFRISYRPTDTRGRFSLNFFTAFLTIYFDDWGAYESGCLFFPCHLEVWSEICFKFEIISGELVPSLPCGRLHFFDFFFFFLLLLVSFIVWFVVHLHVLLCSPHQVTFPSSQIYWGILFKTILFTSKTTWKNVRYCLCLEFLKHVMCFSYIIGTRKISLTIWRLFSGH